MPPRSSSESVNLSSFILQRLRRLQHRVRELCTSHPAAAVRHWQPVTRQIYRTVSNTPSAYRPRPVRLYANLLLIRCDWRLFVSSSSDARTTPSLTNCRQKRREMVNETWITTSALSFAAGFASATLYPLTNHSACQAETGPIGSSEHWRDELLLSLSARLDRA